MRKVLRSQLFFLVFGNLKKKKNLCILKLAKLKKSDLQFNNFFQNSSQMSLGAILIIFSYGRLDQFKTSSYKNIYFKY